MKALLVGVTTKYDRYDIDYSLDRVFDTYNHIKM